MGKGIVKIDNVMEPTEFPSPAGGRGAGGEGGGITA
jgi:hypothetical protein